MTQLPPPDFERNVFINCPFDDEYLKLLHPLLFTLIYLGFTPRIALERSDSGEQRIDKICELIKQSKYSIHDLSRLQSKKKNEYFRLNMPFELGIDYGVRRFAEGYSEKKFLVLSKTRFEYAKAISDISGVDIKSHDDEALKVIRIVRNWLRQYLPNNVRAPQIIWDQFNLFMVDFHDEREKEGFSKEDIYEITSSEVGEFVEHIELWIKKEINPIGPGLGSTASIAKGKYYYTSTTLPAEWIKSFNLTIVDGKIFRNEEEKLIGEMEMVSPIREIQEIIEKNGGNREIFRSNDSDLSTDVTNPTRFEAQSNLTIGTDTYRITTLLEGHLESLWLRGSFLASFIDLNTGAQFQGSGEFEVQLG